MHRRRSLLSVHTGPGSVAMKSSFLPCFFASFADASWLIISSRFEASAFRYHDEKRRIACDRPDPFASSSALGAAAQSAASAATSTLRIVGAVTQYSTAKE